MEEEAREILRDALKQEDVAGGGLGTEIAAFFCERGLEKEIRWVAPTEPVRNAG